MPIYEYICPKCYKELELLQKVNDPEPLCFCDEGDPCPMDRQISKNSFQLKGSGWERDGYASKKERK
jgi:putative FmdB family regulatory protein